MGTILITKGVNFILLSDMFLMPAVLVSVFLSFDRQSLLREIKEKKTYGRTFTLHLYCTFTVLLLLIPPLSNAYKRKYSLVNKYTLLRLATQDTFTCNRNDIAEVFFCEKCSANDTNIYFLLFTILLW